MTIPEKEQARPPMSAMAERAMAAMRRSAIVARRRALENEGKVMIYRDGEMVWETDPKRIFPPGVEIKICECGRVLVNDTIEGVTEWAGE